MPTEYTLVCNNPNCATHWKTAVWRDNYTLRIENSKCPVCGFSIDRELYRTLCKAIPLPRPRREIIKRTLAPKIIVEPKDPFLAVMEKLISRNARLIRRKRDKGRNTHARKERLTEKTDTILQVDPSVSEKERKATKPITLDITCRDTYCGAVTSVACQKSLGNRISESYLARWRIQVFTNLLILFLE